jgi:hypothetical protein
MTSLKTSVAQASELSSDDVELHTLSESDILVKHDLNSDHGNSEQSKVAKNKQNQQNYQNN